MTKIAQLADRSVLRIAGTEAKAFLQDLLTNDVEQVAPGRSAWAGLLSPQGKYLFDMILFDGGDGALLADVEAARAEELRKRLTMYKLRRDVTVERSDLQVYAAWDGQIDGMPADPRLAALGQRWLATGVETNATTDDYEAHRIAHGVPDGSRDMMVDRLMWLEADAVELGGVSFTKGCYVGQENTARMHHRDKLRKRLLPVRLDGPVGEERVIRAGDREAGELRTYRDGRGIAYLRLEHAEGTSPLTLEGQPVVVDWPAWLAQD